MLAILLFVIVQFCQAMNRKNIPPGMNADLFPKQVFDENAPFCQSEREPCGFYSFSLSDGTPFKWIKSWCHCTAGYSCVYERTDMKMRVYRHSCAADGEIPNADIFMQQNFAKKEFESKNKENDLLARNYDGKDHPRNLVNQHLKSSKRRKIFDEAVNSLE